MQHDIGVIVAAINITFIFPGEEAEFGCSGRYCANKKNPWPHFVLVV